MAKRRTLYRGGFATGGLVSDGSTTASVTMNQTPAASLAPQVAVAAGMPPTPAPAATMPSVVAKGARQGGTEGVEASGVESSGNTSEGLGKEAVEGNPGGAAVNYSKGGPVKSVAGKPIGKDDGLIAAQKGEYVVRKAAVKKIGMPAMQAINRGNLPHAARLYQKRMVAHG